MARGGDHGGATVSACLALTGLIAITSMFVGLGAVVVARHRAQAAADLGALAGAGALQGGAEDACAAAAEVVRRMTAVVRACEVTEWQVSLAVERKVTVGLPGVRTVRAVARAGPAE
ncbi:MAG TPA: Rv3654c family TadE-like protein [Nocardia sp.]|uniref:Rv3654c family TadE-like protein n=1 Tax=Nocardia farcinica TaxID=37329 RepID=UPI002454BED4|nr:MULTISPECIES: Rv3654c family TadE-like protein [Nocardia]HLS79399.1 Rv3654c family TadE-like protein [Nocardia sp.]